MAAEGRGRDLRGRPRAGRGLPQLRPAPCRLARPRRLGHEHCATAACACGPRARARASTSWCGRWRKARRSPACRPHRCPLAPADRSLRWLRHPLHGVRALRRLPGARSGCLAAAALVLLSTGGVVAEPRGGPYTANEQRTHVVVKGDTLGGDRAALQRERRGAGHDQPPAQRDGRSSRSVRS